MQTVIVYYKCWYALSGLKCTNTLIYIKGLIKSTTGNKKLSKVPQVIFEKLNVFVSLYNRNN